jgi:acyl transferase domain-containing protein/acyl-CoA synthetase (AMP-forming)/AMP-acid ligase II
MGLLSSQQPIWPSYVVSFAQILEARAERQPDDPAYTFTPDGESVAQALTYAALDRVARQIAARLQWHRLAGERVVLCFPPGLDFVAALYGCFLAKSIAIPAPYQQGRSARARLASILGDATPAAVLSTAAGVAGQASRPGNGAVSSPKWLAVGIDDVGVTSEDYRPETFGDDPVAVLQYTSGSTADPKGVVLRQSTLLANSVALAPNFVPGSEGRCLSWLPTFHDFGLVCGILQPLFTGCPAVLMAPAGFLRSPLSWLHAMWRFQATYSGGPNFAYDLCVERFLGLDAGKKLPPELDNVDLRNWRVAGNGAEPVRLETMERFAHTFGPWGFQFEAFAPCYGLAEATLFVAGAPASDGPPVLHLDATKLREREIDEVPANSPRARTLVGCQRIGEEPVVVIVDPVAQLPLSDLRIGEIWVAGSNVADGYWNQPDVTRETFQATVPGYPGRQFLRTGDEGFLKAGVLFVVGRSRDLIVVRGQNHFFVDLERTAASSHPEVSLHGAVAFVVEADGLERLVLVAELRQTKRRRPPSLDHSAIKNAIRRAIRESHGIDPLAIALVEPMGLPRTSSGKIQRARCKQQYLDATLEFVVEQADEMLGPAKQARGVPTPRHDASPPEEVPADTPRAGRRAQGAAVAIVGAHCRFPGAHGLDELWQLLREGGDAITEVSASRWNADDYYDPRPGTPGKMVTRWGGYLSDVDRFDAQFFGIPPREAAFMDPQQRLLLEVTWETLEAAGWNPLELAGSRTGVYVGIGGIDFAQEVARRTTYDQIDAYTGTGSAHSVAANRLSYFLDLHGPSLAIDTACSSSLVAVHLACEGLRRGECTLALAAGVNVITEPTVTLAFSHARMLSPEGRCKTFDADANGYVRSEGCGVVILKLLDNALRDGDAILGVIRGSAINQDGRTSGITAPNGLAQQAVIRAALAESGLRPSQLGLVEAHGTATPVGDLTELRALADVFRGEPTDGAPCLVGSIKANVGHLETAAGIAGLIKVLLCFRHGEVPAQIHLRRINPEAKIADVPLEIATERKSWAPNGRRRLAGVSSFGFGGTNAHVVIEEPPTSSSVRLAQPNAPSETGLGYVLPLSAKTPEALRELARRYADQLVRADGLDIADVCYTAGVGRSRFPHRCAISGQNKKQVQERLAKFLVGAPDGGVFSGHKFSGDSPRVAFLFTGQGAQYASMARELYEHSGAFRLALDACDAILGPLLTQPLLRVLYGPDASSLLDETEFTQPALFAVEYALAQLLLRWGIRPAAVLGHSVGEYVAACLAGVFTLDDGLRLIAVRARLMQELPRDAMMAAVFADGSAVEKLIRGFGDDVAIAARNAPQNTVIAGHQAAVAAALEEARRRGWKTVRLNVSHAFHSPLMAEIGEPFRAVAQQVGFQAPTLPLISNVTGKPWSDGRVPDADYWTRHLLQPVRFADGVRSLRNAGIDLFVEVGPSPTLSALGRRCLLPGEGTWVHCLARGQDDRDVLARRWPRSIVPAWTSIGRRSMPEPERVARRSPPTRSSASAIGLTSAHPEIRSASTGRRLSLRRSRPRAPSRSTCLGSATAPPPCRPTRSIWARRASPF